MTAFDSDIKIASDKPSRDIKKTQNNPNGQAFAAAATYEAAKAWGCSVAREFIKDAREVFSRCRTTGSRRSRSCHRARADRFRT